jgi:hypothetical protein
MPITHSRETEIRTVKEESCLTPQKTQELGILNSSQMTYRSIQFYMETATDLAFADYMLLSSYNGK